MVSSTISIRPGAIESESKPKVAEPAKKAPYPWIVNPWFDILFCNGGLLFGLFLVHYLVFGWNNVDTELTTSKHAYIIGTSMIILGALGQHIFADTHTVATYMRIYATQESRKTFRLYAYYLPWLSLTLLALAFAFPEAAGTVVYIHMMWVFQHYVGQCFGVALIYCFKRGYYMSNFEREVFRWFMHSFSFAIITGILCDRNMSPYMYWVVEVPFWGLPMWIHEFGLFLFTCMAILFGSVLLRKWHRTGQMMPGPAMAQVATVLTIGFSAGMASSMLWTYAPPFFHGSQYLAISLGFYIKEKGLQEGMLSKDVFRNWFTPRSLRYWAYVIVAGMFIYIFVPHFMANFGLAFGLGGAVIQATINFHHFVSDAAIWRLRDARCRDILIA